jgi:hypothetical protein
MAMILALTAMAGCGTTPGTEAASPPGGAPVSVTSATGMPYSFADGAQARKHADALCGTGGVRTSIYDRYDAARAAWVFPRGCA